MAPPDNPPEFGRREGPPAPIVPKSASEALRPEAGVPPPVRSRHSRNRFVVFLNFVLTLVILAVAAGGLAIYLGKREFDGPGPSEVTRTFLVKPNTGVAQIAAQLERDGLISDARIFRLGVRAYGHDSRLKAGEYAVEPHASMHDIMRLMQSGKSVLYSLTVPEGMTVEQAFARIAAEPALAGDMPAEIPEEGSLIADTQRFTRGATRQQIIDKMLADQKKLVDDIWSRRDPDLPLASEHEFVVLASIVEKETARSDERSRIAAVFLNRLRKGMRLQSDPTIIYGLFGGKGKPPDRPIYQSDIEKATPYNTYVITGLPPTPIANPGRASLEAVANPSRTDDLYFVADGGGGHAFATSLDDHNRNVARYREIQKRQAQEAARAASQQTAPDEPARDGPARDGPARDGPAQDGKPPAR